MKLKKYEDNMKEKTPEKLDSVGSSVACSEEKCKGEMMVVQPTMKHLQLPLHRAICGKCGWRGWV